ncbi:MAG: sugar phosphate isomerase/epimerase family protein [Armatimonadota bacterium]
MANRAALNLATLGPTSLERKLYAAASSGFAAVGLSQAELDAPGERGREELRLSELAVAELEAATGWMAPGRTARTIALMQAEALFAAAAEVGASLAIAWPSDEPVDRLAAATYFGDLCRAAEPLGLRVGLEFLGGSATVPDLSTAWEIVEMAEADNGGLVLDTFQFFRGNPAIDAVEPIPGERIYLVQVSDAPELPATELRDGHRLYPGTGALALEPLLAAIREKGYTGWYSLELHNEEYWAQDPALIAAQGFRAMQRMDLV